MDCRTAEIEREYPIVDNPIFAIKLDWRWPFFSHRTTTMALFESVASVAVRRRLSSSINDKKPHVTATFASLTVRINLFKSWLIVAHRVFSRCGLPLQALWSITIPSSRSQCLFTIRFTAPISRLWWSHTSQTTQIRTRKRSSKLFSRLFASSPPSTCVNFWELVSPCPYSRR